jgi:hypothetical protein
MLRDMDDKLQFIDEIYKTMYKEQIVLCYVGSVTADIVNALLKSFKNDDFLFGQEVVLKKRIYKIIVECLENISRHSEPKDESLPPSIFMLGKEESHFFIISGNFVYNNQISDLRQMIDNINCMEKNAIRDKYMEVLSRGLITPNGGAGLGMYDIALKSGNKLEYNFKASSETLSFYILKVKVDF